MCIYIYIGNHTLFLVPLNFELCIQSCARLHHFNTLIFSVSPHALVFQNALCSFLKEIAEECG